MKAIIITIGDEILMGQILDTNSQYIARSLTDMGVEITEILSIPDKRDEIYETVEYAMSEADLIIVTDPRRTMLLKRYSLNISVHS